MIWMENLLLPSQTDNSTLVLKMKTTLTAIFQMESVCVCDVYVCLCASPLVIYTHIGRLIRNYLAAINSSFHYCQRLINASGTLSFNCSDTLLTKQFYLSLQISLSLFQAKCIPSLKTVRVHLTLCFLTSMSSLTQQL